MAPVLAPPTLLELLAGAFAASGVELRPLSLGLARALPVVTLVPAFGLSAVPVQTRLVLGLCFGLCVAPALGSLADPAVPFVVAFGREALLGLPLALLAALSIYVATLVGGVVDDLVGSRATVQLPTLPEQAPPVAALLSLFSSVAFLETGGATRVVGALAAPLNVPKLGWPAVVGTMARAIELAFAIAAPVAVACVLLEVAAALVARAAAPAFVAPVLAPLKSVALLGVLALVLERVTELLVLVASRAP
jgi:type III secretory pathway component EscT